MSWFSEFWKRKAIKQYARRLGPQLKKSYGLSDGYTSKQIQKAVKRNRLQSNYICFGYCMYLDRENFDAVHRERGEVCDYDAMRQDVANLCFAGYSGFSVAQAIAYGESHGGALGGSGGGDVDGSGDGGGD